MSRGAEASVGMDELFGSSDSYEIAAVDHSTMPPAYVVPEQRGNVIQLTRHELTDRHWRHIFHAVPVFQTPDYLAGEETQIEIAQKALKTHPDFTDYIKRVDGTEEPHTLSSDTHRLMRYAEQYTNFCRRLNSMMDDTEFRHILPRAVEIEVMTESVDLLEAYAKIEGEYNRYSVQKANADNLKNNPDFVEWAKSQNVGYDHIENLTIDEQWFALSSWYHKYQQQAPQQRVIPQIQASHKPTVEAIVSQKVLPEPSEAAGEWLSPPDSRPIRARGMDQIRAEKPMNLLPVEGLAFGVAVEVDRVQEAAPEIVRLSRLLRSPLVNEHPDIVNTINEMLQPALGKKLPVLDEVMDKADKLIQKAESNDESKNKVRLRFYDEEIPAFMPFIEQHYPDAFAFLNDPDRPLSDKVETCRVLWEDNKKDIYLKHVELFGVPQDQSGRSLDIRKALRETQAITEPQFVIPKEVVQVEEPVAPKPQPRVNITFREAAPTIQQPTDIGITGEMIEEEEIVVVGSLKMSIKELDKHYQNLRFRFIEKHPLGKQERATAKMDSQLKREPSVEQKAAVIVMRMQESAAAVRLHIAGKKDELDKNVEVHNRVLNAQKEDLKALNKYFNEIGM